MSLLGISIHAISKQSNIDTEEGDLSTIENYESSKEISNPISTICSYINEVDETKTDRRKHKRGKVDSAHHEPVIYWNELSPTWLTNSMEQRFQDQRKQEDDLEPRWAYPVESLEAAQNDISCVTRGVASHPNRSTWIPFSGSMGIQIKTQLNDWKPSKHIHNYFEMMYVFGTARKRSRNKYCGNKSRIYIVLDQLQAGLHLTVVIGAIFDSGCRAKNCLIFFLEGERFTRFVYFAFHMTTLATSIHGTYLLSQNRDIENMEMVVDIYEMDDQYTTRMPFVAHACAISTAIMSFLLPIFFYGIWDDSFVEVVYDNSFGLSIDIFLWDWKKMNTTIEELDDRYAVPSTGNFAMGAAKIVQTYFANLLTGMIWDLMTTIIIAFNCWKHSYITNEVSKVAENVEDPDSDEGIKLQECREVVFQKWRKFRPVDKAINKVFSPIVPSFHFRNILMYAFLLSICILPDESTTEIMYIFYTYNIVKAEVTYVIASRIVEQNEIHRSWLRNWGMHTGKFTVNGRDYNLHAVLDELDKEPIVFGRGIFAIDQRFHFGMLGLVCSLFVSLANGIGK